MHTPWRLVPKTLMALWLAGCSGDFQSAAFETRDASPDASTGTGGARAADGGRGGAGTGGRRLRVPRDGGRRPDAEPADAERPDGHVEPPGSGGRGSGGRSGTGGALDTGGRVAAGGSATGGATGTGGAGTGGHATAGSSADGGRCEASRCASCVVPYTPCCTASGVCGCGVVGSCLVL